MTPEQAAERLKPFKLEEMPAKDRHHSKFVLAVADALGVPHMPFNIQQVDAALKAAEIREDVHTYPMMLYSRRHHAVHGLAASLYDKRHDYCHVLVTSEEEHQELGSDWIENAADLPPRGSIPIDAPVVEHVAEPEPMSTPDPVV